MTTGIDDRRTGKIAAGSMRIGKAAVLAGLLLIAVTAFFVPDHQAQELARIAGGALVLVGSLGYGLGRLTSVAKRSPRSGAP
ncbi:hypothetical protein JR065_15260 [Xanthomonas sp. AmX2]|uniref:hypothetical protein n=1 Tax=Xanthomonas sp. TaxID=29446 RepID=UPI00197F24B3|nr:hypothetical protein [Xanthomonas sp.]MBN6151703.1 hypothetical protein [Xanthomonas sp.]